ncbi:MAG: sensor domain-containing diguanylate cyclase [Gemmatimonadota bacterium]
MDHIGRDSPADGGGARAGRTARLLPLAAIITYVIAAATGAWAFSDAAVLRAAAPFGAAGLAAAAWLRLPRQAGRPWAIVVLAALAATAGGMLPPAHTMALLLSGTAAGMLALALAWALHERERGRMLEIVADSALLVGAATVLALRWTPDPANDTFLAEAASLVAPVAMLCALLYCAVLVVVQRRAVGLPVALGVGTGAVAIGVGTVLGPGGLALLLQVSGWGLVAAAALFLATRGASAALAPPGSSGGAALRLVVAPAVALGMGAVVVDAGLGAPLGQATGLALGLLGALLALRVAQLLSDTRSLPQERHLLAQNQALVEVSAALAGAEDLDETLRRVTHWCNTLLRADAAVIELLSDDGQSLELRAGEGIPERIVGRRTSVEDSFTGNVAHSGQVATTTDPAAMRDVLARSRSRLGGSPVAAAPLRFHDQVLGVLACVAPHPFDAPDLELLEALAGQAAVAIENARLLAQARQLSVTDPLTGLANRRQLDRDLAREFAAAGRGRRLVAVMLDLDGFKAFNDRHGHLAGDEALRRFASVLAHETRAMNLVARWGGDEFVALVTDVDREGARVFVERVRDQLQRTTEDKRLSVSAGIALYDPSMTEPSDLIRAADAALYEAKTSVRAS